ncbi:hypothetical protein E3E12_07945 [Formicincola oecophyllae]|uniref:Uncharacterized protein n=1 Tax=Formicincola oecophyllae TaxID=2558361 RepID=A0A4Y6UCF2_9PROT|nr:hypothetical protein [Formicincola oecophyllae]QDH14127.1 hypothetical protein E3E12_07945 [Formicincola oecophyllae]
MNVFKGSSIASFAVGIGCGVILSTFFLGNPPTGVDKNSVHYLGVLPGQWEYHANKEDSGEPWPDLDFEFPGNVPGIVSIMFTPDLGTYSDTNSGIDLFSNYFPCPKNRFGLLFQNGFFVNYKVDTCTDKGDVDGHNYSSILTRALIDSVPVAVVSDNQAYKIPPLPPKLIEQYRTSTTPTKEARAALNARIDKYYKDHGQ